MSLESVPDSAEAAGLDKSSFKDSGEPHEMSDERYHFQRLFHCRFQELLIESRKWKSDWIDGAREESEEDLWKLLKSETNILRLTNRLHPNKNT